MIDVKGLWFKTRYAMKAELRHYDVQADYSFRCVRDSDVHSVAELMISAYRGGVDSESESLEEAEAEVRDTFSGKYGSHIPDACLVATVDGRVVSAVIFVWYEDEKMPLMAYAMTHADFKGRGIGTSLIKEGLNRLLAQGYTDCCLAVSEGNEPARTIYQKLGFKDVLKISVAKGERLKDPTLQNATAKLITELKCRTVILYGSRARGDSTENSDYDLVGFAKAGDEISDVRVHEGKYIDAYAYPEKRALEDAQEFLRLRGGIILREENDFGTDLLRRVEAVFQAGPKPLTQSELNHRRLWVKKTLVRLQDNDLESRFRRVWLLNDLLELYFSFRDQWYLGPKESFHWLRDHDPAMYSLFDRALRNDAHISAIHELGERIIAEA